MPTRVRFHPRLRICPGGRHLPGRFSTNLASKNCRKPHLQLRKCASIEPFLPSGIPSPNQVTKRAGWRSREAPLRCFDCGENLELMAQTAALPGNADLYLHVRVLIGIILGLSV